MVDLRCCQGDEGADQAWTAALRAADGRLIGVYDPLLGPVAPAVAAAMQELRPNAYLPALQARDVFLNPAPMRPDQLFIARLLLNRDIVKVALVREAVPPDGSARPDDRLAYFTALAWLRCYDVQLPIAAAGRVWEALAGVPGRFAIGGRRPRLAMLTPLPPARSGVADYSAACIRALREIAEVTVIDPARAGGPVAARTHLARHDHVVSVMGNSHHHAEIFDAHERWGGAVVCHDSRLLQFFSWKLGPAGAAAMASGELGRAVHAAEVLRWHADETARAARCFGTLAERARPLILHARGAAAALGARHLPFAIYRPWDAAQLTADRRREARARLGWDDTPTIASFGHVLPGKGVGAAMQAMAILRDNKIPARLVWAGHAPGGADPLRQQAARLGLARTVLFPDRFLEEAAYRDHLLAADAGLQLRAGGGGNISGALQDCIAAGLPSVANDDLAESLDAPAYVTRVGDALAPAEIALALAAALENRRDTGAARAAYAAAHDMAGYARGLCAILAALA